MSTHNTCFRGEIRKNVLWMRPLIWRYVCKFYIIKPPLAAQSDAFRTGDQEVVGSIPARPRNIV